MQRSASIFSFALLLWMASVQAQQTASINAYDFAELAQSIDFVNQLPTGSSTRINILGRIDWPSGVDPRLPTVTSDITISGGTFSEVDGGGAGLFSVDSSGKLTVVGSTFVDISHGGFGPTIFNNYGVLDLESVTFTSVAGTGVCGRFGCRPSESALIYNTASGKLALLGVRFEDSGSRAEPNWGSTDSLNGILANEGTAKLIRTHVYLSHNRWEQPFSNSGFMRLENVSFLVRNDPDIPSLDLFQLAEGAKTESVNSVFEGFTGAWCKQVTSLGHNSNSAQDCQWASAGDKVGEPTGIFRRSIGDTFDLVPSVASLVVDSSDGDWCTDIEIFDGNGDGVAACDRGAHELPPIKLAEGGINGFYYNPAQDGHYVYVLETDYTTLVVWNTFDASGNHVWIYGVGELVNGRSVVAEAYINRAEGPVSHPSGAAITAEPWGELEVDMESCTKGHVAYRSDLPEFGSGQFPIERLAYVKQLGCVDPK